MPSTGIIFAAVGFVTASVAAAVMRRRTIAAPPELRRLKPGMAPLRVTRAATERGPGSLALYADELIFLGRDEHSRVTLADIRDVVRVSSMVHDDRVELSSMIKVEWAGGVATWLVGDADAWVAALATAR